MKQETRILNGCELSYMIDGLRREYKFHKKRYIIGYDWYKRYKDDSDLIYYKNHFVTCIKILQLLNYIDYYNDNIAIIKGVTK